MKYIKAAAYYYVAATIALAAGCAAVGFTLGLMYGAAKIAAKLAAGLL